MQHSSASMLFVLVTVLLDAVSLGLITPVLPWLVQSFTGGGMPEASHAYGLLVAGHAAMVFLFSPVIGRLSDRVGRRPVFLLTLSGIAAFNLVAATTGSLVWLFVARIAAGACGANIATASAYAADVTPPAGRARTFALMGAVFGFGFTIGPALGGLLAEVGPRIPFWVAGATALLNLVYGAIVLPESLGAADRRPLTVRGTQPFAALGRLREMPAIRTLAAAFFFFQLARATVQANWVLFTEYRFGWTERDAGLSLAVFGVLNLVMLGGFARFVIARLGDRSAARLGILVMAVSCVLYAFAARGWEMYAVMVVSSFGFLAAPALQGLVSQQVPGSEQGELQGAMTSLTSLGLAVGPVLGASTFGLFTGPAAPIVLPGASFLLAATLMAVALIFASRAPARLAVA